MQRDFVGFDPSFFKIHVLGPKFTVLFLDVFDKRQQLVSRNGRFGQYIVYGRLGQIVGIGELVRRHGRKVTHRVRQIIIGKNDRVVGQMVKTTVLLPKTVGTNTYRMR